MILGRIVGYDQIRSNKDDILNPDGHIINHAPTCKFCNNTGENTSNEYSEQ